MLCLPDSIGGLGPTWPNDLIYSLPLRWLACLFLAFGCITSTSYLIVGSMAIVLLTE